MGLLFLLLALATVAHSGPISIPIHRKPKELVRDRSGLITNVRDPRIALNKRSLRRGGPSMFPRTFPLRGNWSNLALWYMQIEVGPSQQIYHVQVDTGSSDLGIPDVSCSCGQHLDAPWNPTQAPGVTPASCNGPVLQCSGNSASCTNNQCSYTISYGDGSGYTALVYNTSVMFGSVDHNGIVIPSQYVGSIVSEVTPNGPFEPPAVDGIAGFAQQYLSVVNAPPMIAQLSADNNASCPFIFSLCGDVHRVGGLLTVCGGGNNHIGQNQWTPMIGYDSQGFYNVFVVDFAVNGQRLGIDSSIYNNGLHAVDSGTTLMLLPDVAFAAMKKAFLALCSSQQLHGVCDVSSSSTLFDGGACFSMTPSQLAAFPTIQLLLGSGPVISVDITANAYLVPGFCSDPSQYSLSLTPIGGEGTLLGDPIMLAQEVTYDVVRQRMGFAPKSASCVFSQK